MKLYIKNLAGDVSPVYANNTKNLYHDLFERDTYRPFRLFREDRELLLEDEIKSGEILSILYLDREYLSVYFTEEPIFDEIGELLYNKVVAQLDDRTLDEDEEYIFNFYTQEEYFYREAERTFPLSKEEFFSEVPYFLGRYTYMPCYKARLPSFLLDNWNSAQKSYEMWDELDKLGYFDEEEDSEDFGN